MINNKLFCRTFLNYFFSSAQNVEELLHEFDSFSINVPELNILRQYHVDTLSWISRFNDVMVDVREGKDQRKLISDLSSLLRDGASLGIQGLSLVPTYFSVVMRSDMLIG